MRSLRSIVAVTGMVLVTGLAFQGCGKQTEGQRCEVDDDCDTNLKCTNVGSSDKICCPDRASATTTECRNGVTVTDTGTATDTGAPADTGTAAETATDTGTTAETATDTGAAADTTPATTDAADAD